MPFLKLVHFVGSAMWIGGFLAALLLVSGARDEAEHVRAGLFRLLAQVYTTVIGLGAVLTLGSGILWGMSLSDSGGVENGTVSVAFWVMVLAGFVGGLLVLFVAMPTAIRLARAAVPTPDGRLTPTFERHRGRLLAASLVAEVLALVSLFAAVGPW